MSRIATPSPGVKALRLWLGITSALALITGILVAFWPSASAQVISMILGVYAVVAGVIYLVTAFSGAMSGWARVGHVLAGLLYIAAGVIAFMNPGSTAVILAVIVTTFIAISWIFDGVAALSTLSLSPSKGWSVFYAIVSILGGIALLAAPLFAATFLLIWVGVTLIVIGVVGLIRAFTLGRD